MNLKDHLPGRSRPGRDVPAPPTAPPAAGPSIFEKFGGFAPIEGPDVVPDTQRAKEAEGARVAGALVLAQQAAKRAERDAQLAAERAAEQQLRDEIWARYKSGAPKVGR